MWVGHERHCIWNTDKVKRPEVKVTRSRDVVAQKHRLYPRKHHSVVEIHLSYRKSRSPKRMAVSGFYGKFLNSRFCAFALKICPKLASSVVKSHNFIPFTRSHGRWIRWWGNFCRSEAELTLLLRMRTKEIAKTAKMYSDRTVTSLLQ